MTGESPFESLMEDFLVESHERLDRVEAIILVVPDTPDSERRALFHEAKRELHTLKGNSGMMGLTTLQMAAHDLEDEISGADLEHLDAGPLLAGVDKMRKLLKACAEPAALSPETVAGIGGETDKKSLVGSVRVPFAALDALVDLLAEMVIFRNRLGDAVLKGHLANAGDRMWEDVSTAQDALNKTLTLIQDHVMRLRMVPLRSLFTQLRRIVHDESIRCGKTVQLVAEGGDTPMDKALLEVCSEILGHLVRNAVVHGIERPDVRKSAVKSGGGAVRLAATIHASELWIDVQDDGAGIDRESLAMAAERLGLAVPEGDAIYGLLFQPEFTTKDGADVSSGRGMGLAAVAQAVRAVSGRVEVESSPGIGSRFRIKLPLSVSISHAMIVAADGEEYALPLSSIVESLRLRCGDGHLINDAGVLPWRGEVVPIIDLGHVFGTSNGLRDQGYVVLLEVEGRHRGVVVDELTGIKEIVVKGLDASAGSPEGISGATILGDGRVLLILDPKQLVSMKPFIHAVGGVPEGKERAV